MRYLEIRLTKTTLVLTEAEILKAVGAFPELFKEAVTRGKGLLRAEKATERIPKSNRDTLKKL